MRHYAQDFEPLSQLSGRMKCYEFIEPLKSLVAGPTSPKWLRRLKGEV